MRAGDRVGYPRSGEDTMRELREDDLATTIEEEGGDIDEGLGNNPINTDDD
jgi:hypothetical protein